MAIEIPWYDGMLLGKGYDIETSQSAALALNVIESELHLRPLSELTLVEGVCKYILQRLTHPEEPKNAVSVEPKSHIIRDEAELNSVLDALFKACLPASPLFSLEASARYLRSIKCNQTTITTIIQCSITSKCLEQVIKAGLADQAKKRLKPSNLLPRNRERFWNAYGKHYISAFKYQSTFAAVLTHLASTKEQLDELILKLGGKYKITELDAAISFMKTIKSSHIDTRIQVEMNGFNGDNVSKHISVNEFEGMLNDFLENYITVPQIAVLEPYNTVDPNVPVLATKSASRTAKISTVYQRCLHLEIRAGSCRMIGAQKLMDEIMEVVNQGRQLANAQMSDRAWEKALSKHDKKLRALKDQIDAFINRENLLQQSRSLSSEEWTEKWHKKNLTAGETSFKSLEHEVRCDEDTFIRESGSWLDGSQSGTIPVSTPRRIIISARVESMDAKEPCGRWRRKTGWIGQDKLEVEFETSWGKGASWKLKVWSVDAILYEVAKAP